MPSTYLLPVASCLFRTSKGPLFARGLEVALFSMRRAPLVKGMNRGVSAVFFPPNFPLEISIYHLRCLFLDSLHAPVLPAPLGVRVQSPPPPFYRASRFFLSLARCSVFISPTSDAPKNVEGDAVLSPNLPPDQGPLNSRAASPPGTDPLGP